MKIDKLFLEYHYITLGKSSEKIGKEIGTSGRNVRYYLTKFGFQEIMHNRKRSSIGKSPPNKGVFKPNPALGRRYISINGRTVPRYRYLMEQHLGRKLHRSEIVHHIDGNPLNDTINNLIVITQSTHIKHHNPVLARWAKQKS